MLLKKSKKGELILLSIILLVALITGLVYVQQQIENQKYIGNIKTKIVYNLNSANPNCQIQNLRIDTSNVIFFKTESEVIASGFTIDKQCA
mgnify:CR=1 FL=1